MHRVVGALVTLAVAALLGCGSTTDTENDSSSTTTGGSASSSDLCSRFGENVLAYDILLPGASRGEYLTLLHRFQRDCPEEAANRGLTNEGAPQCVRLDQENCTMWLPTP